MRCKGPISIAARATGTINCLSLAWRPSAPSPSLCALCVKPLRAFAASRAPLQKPLSYTPPRRLACRMALLPPPPRRAHGGASALKDTKDTVLVRLMVSFVSLSAAPPGRGPIVRGRTKHHRAGGMLDLSVNPSTPLRTGFGEVWGHVQRSPL
jgi:hypothetical protein